MSSRRSLLVGVLVASVAVSAVNATEIELMSPQLRQAALRHLSVLSASKATVDVDLYLEGYTDGVKAQLMGLNAPLPANYAGDKSWARGYEQGIVDAKKGNGAISFADIGYERLFKGVGGFQFSFERSSFSPEGAKEQWWVEALPGVSFNGCGRCFVQGWITKPGRFGHMGQYQRTIMVISVKPKVPPVGTRQP